MNRHTPRIRDVARAAGVSTATVSRALSKPEIVSPATLEAVLAAVQHTGYTINQAARNLRQMRTMGVIELVPNLANPVFSRILAGVSAVLAQAGYKLLVVDTQGPGVGRHIARTLDRSRADGLIVCDGQLPAADLQPDGLRPPVVMACEWVEGLKTPTAPAHGWPLRIWPGSDIAGSGICWAPRITCSPRPAPKACARNLRRAGCRSGRNGSSPATSRSNRVSTALASGSR